MFLPCSRCCDATDQHVVDRGRLGQCLGDIPDQLCQQFVGAPAAQRALVRMTAPDRRAPCRDQAGTGAEAGSDA